MTCDVSSHSDTAPTCIQRHLLLVERNCMESHTMHFQSPPESSSSFFRPKAIHNSAKGYLINRTLEDYRKTFFVDVFIRVCFISFIFGSGPQALKRL